MEDKEKIFTNADAIRQLNNDDLELLLCNHRMCKECDLKELCGDKYPNGFEDWLNAEYSGNIFEELYMRNLTLSMSRNRGFPPYTPSKTEMWLLRVIEEYERWTENKRRWKEEKKEKKKVREDKILIIDDLTYTTLSKVFDNNLLYDTNRIIIKQKIFTDEDVERALVKHTKYLSDVYTVYEQFVPDGNPLDNRGKVIDLLRDMLDYDLSDTSEMATAIQETLLFRQMQLYGMRKFVYSNKFKCRQRYFNPEAPIVVELLE